MNKVKTRCEGKDIQSADNSIKKKKKRKQKRKGISKPYKREGLNWEKKLVIKMEKNKKRKLEEAKRGRGGMIVLWAELTTNFLHF